MLNFDNESQIYNILARKSIFENLMNIKHFNIPVFIPELACPFQCVYCNQRKISGQYKTPSTDDVKVIIEEHLATIPSEGSRIELAFFGGNFTGIPEEEQISYLEVVQPYIEARRISGIRLSTRPDYINEDILLMLKKYHVQTIELGAQSLDDEVLQLSRRGHTREDVEKASAMINQYGFRLGLQMMIGLPGDTFERSFRTAKKIIDLGAMDTRIYPCLVIKGTKLEEWYKKGEYKPLKLETAVKWSGEIFKLFESANVNIIRLGLHPSEGLLSGEELIAGPFHQSFRELVLTQLWCQQLQPLIWIHKQAGIKIYVPPGQVNYAVGYQSKNKTFLSKHYQEIAFKTDVSLQGREFRVE